MAEPGAYTNERLIGEMSQLSVVERDANPVGERDANPVAILEDSDWFCWQDLPLTVKDLTKQWRSSTRNAVELLVNLRLDLMLALTITEWHEGILYKVFPLAHFLKDCCGTNNHLISTLNKEIEGGNSEAVQLKILLEKAKVYVDEAYDSFRNHVSNLSPKIINLETIAKGSAKGNAKIPTETLLELIILNEVQNRSETIWSQVDEALLDESQKESIGEKSEEGKREEVNSRFPKVVKTIESILAKLSRSIQQKETEADKKSSPRMSWRSRTYAIVLDPNTRTILLGGTKPACNDSGVFAQLSRFVFKRRIGKDNIEIVDRGNEEFVKRAKDAKSTHEGHERPAALAQWSDAEKLKAYHEMTFDWGNKIRLSTVEMLVLSLAFDGFTLKFKPPCLRCQFLYSTWVMLGKPCTDGKMRSSK